MTQPGDPSVERAHERKDVLLSANLLVGGKKVDCEIVNVSFGGAQVRVSGALQAGEKVILEIDPFGSYNTEVRWCLPPQPDIGLKFNDDQTKVAELVMAIATYA
ncbi:MAG: PilZ domain-containing protein [Rhodospirillales bacterium]|nr:PilZ domain-containing protein [Rhodospirillales bacterium]